MGTRYNRLIEAVHTTVNPSFTILKWGVRGYSLHGLVFVMASVPLFPRFVFDENQLTCAEG